MKNPFVYGKEVSGEHFCNRSNEIAELLTDIKNSQNIIIFSPRRYGKTSLIRQVLDLAKSEGLLTFYVDLYPAINKQSFIEIYAKALSEGLPGKASRIAKKLREYLPRIIPKIVVDDKSMQFEFEFDRSANISPHIDDLLEAVKKAADQQKKDAVVVFDEFQEITNFEDDEIERRMRSAFQTHRNVSYIFMGSKTHLMNKMFNNPNRPFYKSGKIFPLQKIDPLQLSAFAEKKFQDSGISVAEKGIAEVIEVTECYPYYFQMLCHVLWDLCQEDQRLTHSLIEKAVDTLISRESSTYIAIWEGLTNKQRKLMVALAKEQYPEVFSKNFLTKYSLGASSSIQKAIKKLLEKDLILQANGSYVIYDLFFARWIRRVWD